MLKLIHSKDWSVELNNLHRYDLPGSPKPSVLQLAACIKETGMNRLQICATRTHTNPTNRRVLVAQLVLHLLPSPHFSLLVYILAFFLAKSL
ncbi:hypothetical protein BYT27DRAFT_7187651 [Phlegmacium glaucopus]|nr:hypothetical protein BYT27DRAFT_7187651 [Phlegmacium glaucopus]